MDDEKIKIEKYQNLYDNDIMVKIPREIYLFLNEFNNGTMDDIKEYIKLKKLIKEDEYLEKEYKKLLMLMKLRK